MAVVGMAFRVIRREWSRFVLDPEHPEVGVSDRDAGALATAGELVHALAEYDLETAATHLEGLPADPPTPAVVAFAVEFLRRHRRSDGTYGYWTDEETVYTALGHRPGAFYERLIRPMSARIDRAIAGLETEDGDDQGRPNGGGTREGSPTLVTPQQEGG
jgi:hypothetical protein